jgi:YrbI family 3-deoxy-D-manno-octulosonate 8-phosphate phosphatase
MDYVVKGYPKMVAIIPARGGSKSIPRKNIKLLGGYPLIAYSIAAGLGSKYIDRVIVSTDDREIAEVARQYGAEVPFMRPPELAEDKVTDLPVFQHTLQWLKQNEKYVSDIVVQLRPTSPFRPLQCVDEAVQLLISHKNADAVRGVTPSGQNPYKMWRIGTTYMEALVQGKFSEPYNMPRQKLPKTYWQTGHIDVIRRQVITEKKSMTGGKILPYLIEPQYAIDLDTLVQWEFAEYVIRNSNICITSPDGICHTALKDIQLVVSDFDGVLTDNRVFLTQDGTESVVCSRGDGMGIARLRKIHVPFIVLSTEENAVVSARCKKLQVPCYQGIHDKADAIGKIAMDYDVQLDQIAYVGNDVNDLDVLKKVGLSITVLDAHSEVLRDVKWVLSKAGGQGAIRELCDAIVSAKTGVCHATQSKNC